MKIRILIGSISLLLLTSSCAKIPASAVTVMNRVAEEGERMHQLNVELINSMFRSKANKIDSFIEHEFTPQYVNEFLSKVPNDMNWKEELPDVLLALIPEINKLRDEMQSALEDQRIKILTKLNEEYAQYREATGSLQYLLESSVKVQTENQALMTSTNRLMGNPVDLNKIETTLDEFITKGGKIGDKITELSSKIDEVIKK